MFEKLAGNVLSKILSKYFTEESLTENNATRKAHLGIWSGYITLHNLQVKNDIINEKLFRKGQPFELVHCSLRQIEITIPWAKLSNPIGGSGERRRSSSAQIPISPSKSSQEAVAVLVLDGVHALFRTSFEFHDEELRAEEIKKRREALSRSENFAKFSASTDEQEFDFSLEETKTYTEILKKRITSGLLREVLDKLHIHVRDFHVRIEDNESNPVNPCAFGITMESMHIQDGKIYDDSQDFENKPNDEDYGVVSKVAQINHFAAYWNALDYGDDLPVENSIIRQTCGGDPEKISDALDFCIVRRGSLMSSPSRSSYIPTHTFLLLPVGGQVYFMLSNNPKNLSARPAIEIDIELDCISTNLRDFQCIQLLRLYKTRKNFQFVKKYRLLRPKVSIMKDPRAWWLYAARVIKFELKDNFLRWSWNRFQRKYAIRARYMTLYGRKIRQLPSRSSRGLPQDDDDVSNTTPLSESEAIEIQELEDGIHGDLAVTDIILYRALVNMRVYGVSSSSMSARNNDGARSSWLNETVQDATVEDVEAREEFERLLQYIDRVPSNNDTSMPEVRNHSLVAVAVLIQVEEVRFALFAPLHITAKEKQLKRLHEKFLEFHCQGTRIYGTLRGDYRNFGSEFSIQAFTASEIRMDKSHHVVASQLKRYTTPFQDDNDQKVENESEPLFLCTFTKNPITKPGVSKELRLLLNPLEINVNLECQWLIHLKGFVREISTAPNVEKFWAELSLAYLNSLTLGKLALMAKAESAASDHENLDVDIAVHCPVFRVSMGGGGDLVIDLGTMSLKTDRLAGISRNQRNQFASIRDNESVVGSPKPLNLRKNSTDDSSVSNSKTSTIPSSIFRTPTRNPIRNLVLSTTMSMDSFQGSRRGHRSFSGSFSLDDAFPTIEQGTDRKTSEQDTGIEELFYDKYKLCLQTGKITFSGESEIFDISMGFELNTTIQKSVIPTDHTLCKMKAHTIVDRVNLVLNEDVLSRLLMAFQKWKTLLASGVTPEAYRSGEDAMIIPKVSNGQFIPIRDDIVYEEDSTSSGTVTMIDEFEFFDANEGTDSMGGENTSGIWFEDNWILDAESVIDGGSRGSSSDRRFHRRQPSLSDVSSMSDHSKTRRSQLDNGYLNAENLARLEEGVGEDDSIAESGNENDDHSFHSAMSLGGQMKLLSDLQHTISDMESKIEGIVMDLADDLQSLTDASDVDLRRRRNNRRKRKQELKRAKAEVNALKAVCHDLDALLSNKDFYLDSEQDKEEIEATTVMQVKSARALIRAQRHRESVENDQSGHRLVKNLNRELFKGSVLVTKIQLTFRAGGRSNDVYDDSNIADFNFTANQMALALFRYVNETKLYFSLDQVTANITNVGANKVTPSLLFSGGSSDTPLPVHLPHLVAHSMEDRFIRGAIATRRHRSGESSKEITKSRKVRLVVGDVEISPSLHTISPVLQCLRRVKATATSSVEVAVQNETKEDEGDHKNEDIEKLQEYTDVVIRLTSFRVALPHEQNIIGALVVSESSLWILRLTSQNKNRAQVEFRCANAQILDVGNLEAGRGSEVVGRRDPYNFLFQLRVRSQIVPSNERGGWVVGSDNIQSSEATANGNVRNIHVGIKISPISLVAASESFSRLQMSARELRQLFQTQKRPSQETPKAPLVDRIAGKTPLRWRFDLVLRRINIRFPEESTNEWNISDVAASKMVVAFTTVLSVQESPDVRDQISIRIGVTDLSMIRSADDWPILEPFSIIFDLTITSNLVCRLNRESNSVLLPLEIKPESPLNEIESVMKRFGWESVPSRKNSSEETTVILKITPLHVNISVRVLGFLKEILLSFRPGPTCMTQNESNKVSSTPSLLPSSKSLYGKRRFGVQLSIEYAEIQLLRENDSKPIAYASRLISFTMTDVSVDYSQADHVSASVLIRDSALFDLSSGKGIRVIGEDPEARLEFPYFVRIEFCMHMKEVQTIRLHINWGKIQCLVVPSFFRSILDLKDGMRRSNGVIGVATTNDNGKPNFITRFLHHPNDVNLIISADAETFECILASRDIVEFVKSGDRDPFGVVTFRWKASLSLAVALDCLQDSSMPWLTLNFDGVFTDEDDIHLFKDFSNNYLGHGALLQVDGEQGSSKLVNAFTTKMKYKLSAFQVLRTNITLMELPNASPKSFAVMPRICFAISQPFAGEQRITNPIDLNLLYRATGTSIASGDGFPDYDVKLAQLLNVKANFLDVLVYMGSRSSGGFSDSFRVSVRPILDMLKRNDGKRVSNNDRMTRSPVISNRNRRLNFMELMKSSPTVCRVEIDGFLVTCVPGGASRLNESPIVKFELSDISSGMAAVPVSRSLEVGGGRGIQQQEGGSRPFLSPLEVMNLTVGGWITCQVTGHYHNRRLVAWEPFIEPWIPDLSFGIDLVEALRLKPIVKQEACISRTPTESSLQEISEIESAGTGKDRLREIGRLIRSPFQSLQSATSSAKGSGDISHSDLCYLMLSSSARSTLSFALYKSSGSRSEIESKLFNHMPSRAPVEWLQGFGKPVKNLETRDTFGPFSVSVVLSDRIPLNVNITGAFIENVKGYVDNTKRNGSNAVVPHLIRNASGMKIRFREVLDTDRAKRRETAAKIVLTNGSEAPLTLKRSLSQTCDPHRAYIYLELGGFEDTIGRINHSDFDVPKGKRSANFLFKASAKIPVDAVGVHRYPLDRNVKTRRNMKESATNSRALGWIIVRVELRGNVKVVSIESPFVLKSAADADLVCEIRDESGLSLLWRCIVPKEEGTEIKGGIDGIVSVPADIVPLIQDGSYRFSVTALSRSTSFSHESEIISTRNNAVEISTPPAFSPKSFGRGLIGEEDIVLPALICPDETREESMVQKRSERIHLTSCAVRIGNANFSRVDSSIEVPEQRMIFFRSPLLIGNFLALPLVVQVRVKSFPNRILNSSISNSATAPEVVWTEWEELGILDCGETIPWTGSPSSTQLELRMKFVGTDGDNSRRYPGWSSSVNIPGHDGRLRSGRLENTRKYGTMKVFDAENVALNVSVAFDFGSDSSSADQFEDESIRQYCKHFSSAARTASIFVPYWIIDGTLQDLEFFAGSPVAGQLDGNLTQKNDDQSHQRSGNTLGLAELMDNQDFLHSSSGSGFEVLMIGEENVPRLSVRKRLARKERQVTSRNVSPWSESIPLQATRKSRHDITVLTPNEGYGSLESVDDDGLSYDRLVLRSSIVNANDRFGGHLGTKMIHIVNRYYISNETGRDIEIATNVGSSTNVVVSATTAPQPFHFDDTRQIQFRFKEFGWVWSGSFKIRLNQREITMRLRHKMKGHTIIVTVEVRAPKRSATHLIVFRESSHPPFRLENHTMYPLSFGQSLSGLGSEDNDCDSLLLQYQNENFAWDEPELNRRSLLIKSSPFMDNPKDVVFGRFPLDKIAPGTILDLESDLFTAEVVADGPTRVLRISDASMPRLPSVRQAEFDYFRKASEISKPLTTSLSIKLSHGVGISVIDFSPKELLYICLEDIEVDKRTDNKKDEVRFSIGNIKFNNQLWVTPYPVFLRMGRRNLRKRNRRHDAISVSWRSSLNTHGGYGNLTLLDWLEITSEPIFANVDGELAGLLFQMARQASFISTSGTDSPNFLSRDDELKSLLAFSGVTEYTENDNAATRNHGSLQDDASGEPLTTAAIAAKLRNSPTYSQQATPRSGYYLIRNSMKKRKKQPLLSKAQHKFYIERLKISTTRADLSWSGVLPGLLSSSVFKALTFERLPLRLRPFSNSHAYGNIEDHLQILRSHYVSIWRIVDVFLGLSSAPAFLVRGVFHTFREGWASILDSWAMGLKYYATQVNKLLPSDSSFRPIYDDGNPYQDSHRQKDILKRVSAPVVNLLSSCLNRSSLVLSLFSQQMKYSPKSNNTRQTRGLVRSRNPRLFAHLDGKDLLVEYVEGENAGKALLSRVRSGLHLGEGYFYHAEGVRQVKSYFKLKPNLDPTPLILMVTLERILLLTGKLDQDFCSVEWEAYFTNIVHVDLMPGLVIDKGSTFPYDEIVLWHLSDPEFSVGNRVDKTHKYARNLASGIDLLHSKSIFVPHLLGEQILAKMKLVEYLQK